MDHTRLYFCEICGIRVLEADLAADATKSPPERALCPKCAKAGVAEGLKAAHPKSTKTGSVHPIAAKVRPSTERVSPTAPRSQEKPDHRAPMGWAFVGIGAAVLTSLFLMVWWSSGPSTVNSGTLTKGKTESVAPKPPPLVFESESHNTKRDPPKTAPRSPKSAEEEAQEAWTVLLNFNGLAANDTKGRQKRLEEFLAQYGQTIAASRARILLDEIKKQAEPPLAAKTAEVTPEPASTPTMLLPAKTDSVALFRPNLNASSCPGLSIGEMTHEPPAGVAGKAVKFLPPGGRSGEVRGGFASFAFPKGAPERDKKTLCVMPENAVLRFQYYAENATSLNACIASSEETVWLKTIEPLVLGTWTQAEIPLSEFKARGGGAGIKADTSCAEVFVTVFGNGKVTAYMADLEIAAPKK